MKQHAQTTHKLLRISGTGFSILAALVHATGYGMYAISVWFGDIDANIVSWGLFACEFLVLAIYRDFTNDWAKDLLYVVCAVLGLGIFVLVLAKLYLTGTPIDTQFDRYDIAVVALNIFVFFMWTSFRDKGTPVLIDVLLQITIVLDFIPILRTTLADSSTEWYVPWAVWTSAYLLQLICVALRWDGRWESVTTTLHYILWHGGMFLVIYFGAAL